MDPLVIALGLFLIFVALRLGRLVGRSEGRRDRGAPLIVIRQVPLTFPLPKRDEGTHEHREPSLQP